MIEMLEGSWWKFVVILNILKSSCKNFINVPKKSQSYNFYSKIYLFTFLGILLKFMGH
jgi:hypothetical protein